MHYVSNTSRKLPPSRPEKVVQCEMHGNCPRMCPLSGPSLIMQRNLAIRASGCLDLGGLLWTRCKSSRLNATSIETQDALDRLSQDRSARNRHASLPGFLVVVF